MTEVAEKPVQTKEFDGILTNRDGEILINCFQQDLILIRNVYADGTVDFWTRPYRGGEDARLVIERHDPEQDAARCRHCGEKL